jgi:hypothetical protein
MDVQTTVFEVCVKVLNFLIFFFTKIFVIFKKVDQIDDSLEDLAEIIRGGQTGLDS